MSNISALPDSVHILLSVLSLALSLLAPSTAARCIDSAKPVLAVSWLQLVVTWGNLLFLALDTPVRSRPLEITSSLCAVFFGLAVAIQVGQLHKEASRVWTYYSWSWILGCVHEAPLLVQHSSTPLDNRSGGFLVLAILKLLGYITLLIFFTSTYETKHNTLPLADRDSPDYINRPVENEIKELGGIWPWIKEFIIFGAIIWTVGNPKMQACLVLSLALRGLEAFVSASCTHYETRLINAVQNPTSGHEFRKPLLLWFILKALGSIFGLPIARSRLWTRYKSHRDQKMERMGYERVVTLGHSFHAIHDPNMILEQPQPNIYHL